MDKNEMITKISIITGISRKEILFVMDSLIGEIKNAVSNGETVYLRGFGCFTPAKMRSRSVRDFGTNTNHIKNACVRPKFKPYKPFIEIVNKNHSKHP